jgi:hypothetical protein
MMIKVLDGIRKHSEYLNENFELSEEFSDASQCFGFDVDGPDFRLIVLTDDYDDASNVFHKILSVFGAGHKLDMAEAFGSEKMFIDVDPNDFDTVAELYNSGNLGAEFVNTSNGQVIKISKEFANHDDQIFATVKYIPIPEIVARYMNE